MRMKLFLDQVEWLRAKTEIFDFLLTQSLDSHAKFLYGVSNADDIEELLIYETLNLNINKILFSEDEMGWRDEFGIVYSEDHSDMVRLYDEDDIKKLYMEQLS